MACEPKPIANISIKPSVESSIVSACKNENIKVDIDSDIEDLDDSSSKVTLTNLPIIVKKMEAEESAIEVIEAASEEEEVVDTESVEEEEEEADEVVEEEEEEEAASEAEKEEEVASEAEKEEEEEEAASEAEKEEEADEDENSVETETKEEEEEQAESEQEQAESEQEQAESEQEEELFEIDIDDITYCTNDEENGSIYELKDGDVGDKVGYFKEGEPFFYADEN
jgi:outer membrane biosynthesis protein TonB